MKQSNNKRIDICKYKSQIEICPQLKTCLVIEYTYTCTHVYKQIHKTELVTNIEDDTHLLNSQNSKNKIRSILTNAPSIKNFFKAISYPA